MKKLKIERILEYPEARQSTNFSCGAASIQAVLYYYGIDIREDNIIKQLKVRPTNMIHSGIDPDVMKQSLEDIWGLRVDMHSMTLEDLKAYIDKKIPVILAIQAWKDEGDTKGLVDYRTSYKDGHYVTAIGYTKTHIIFEDPSILSNRGFLSFEELEARWHDMDYKGNRYEHLGLAVYGKNPRYQQKVAKRLL